MASNGLLSSTLVTVSRWSTQFVATSSQSTLMNFPRTSRRRIAFTPAHVAPRTNTKATVCITRLNVTQSAGHWHN
ncbi:hypothetical protein SNOG_09562 [Parastagonospora nodorum SN15]|uniref:Uncharacterized protein n=1 Tax=Phaeosphaeria nodorum (strain SN15 / ATCC MYA-4574 / FGSC 10173) TaxID=321614 RepID=Q0UFA2_PHANO|nr:hypothetical protein SNOG_09562 [Parastagonospora nodorum SN15]EAT82827.2 hypothetical protein SNOG_09562 [Parastagonospora nodorum SN15]